MDAKRVRGVARLCLLFKVGLHLLVLVTLIRISLQ